MSSTLIIELINESKKMNVTKKMESIAISEAKWRENIEGHIDRREIILTQWLFLKLLRDYAGVDL